ncbi:glycosyltransferase family 2 protein [Pseudomonas huanghezhanensis]|uniref:glycosyltransferase family 2 protein n=1 Tax=Pseudomonas huanghezhanensis TaxID=3002903 RepID=UPI0022868F92|nr:glycosyltransferase family 2 protein [Pseudomonas sp. BSw22131]
MLNADADVDQGRGLRCAVVSANASLTNTDSTEEGKQPVSSQVKDQAPQAPFGGVEDPQTSVAILMCTFNGALFLDQQLDSFEAQSCTNWTLYASDDGSTDATKKILAEYQTRWGSDRLIILDGPRKGFGQNFLSLIRRPEINARYFAFSDQDDIWFHNKLERSIAHLQTMPPDRPCIFCSRTRLVDEKNYVIGHSPAFLKPPSFQNALVQSIAGANTMLVNGATRQLLAQVSPEAKIIAHDWLTYLLVTACGGSVKYDVKPSIDYRQHSNNIIGANSSWRERVIRLRKMCEGQRKEWSDANLSILNDIHTPLSSDAKETLLHFSRGRAGGIATRLREIIKSGIYRQTLEGNLSLYAAAILGKI